MSSGVNKKTLTTYNSGVEDYVKGTVQQTSGFQKAWLDYVFANTPSNSKILEIGSAFGRDAKYLIDKGFEVELTDAAAGFVTYLKQHDFKAQVLDIVENSPKSKYDLILACAVFLHFDESDFDKATMNVKHALKEGGRFAFSLKKGNGEEWSDVKMGAPRYFRYWQPDELTKRMEALGFRVVDMQQNEKKWLHVVCSKTLMKD